MRFNPRMIWSDDALAMVRPFRAYAGLAAAEDVSPARVAAARAAFFLFVVGAFVSLTTAGRLVAFHVLSTMVFWSFVPLVQAGVFVVVLRVIRPPRRPPAQGLALYFAGHGPWMVFFMLIAGICLMAPDVAATMTWLLRTGVLPGLMLATIVWSALLTYACFRVGVGLARGRAAAATALFYAGFSGVIVGYYLAMNEIQPQLPWAP
jgi:hypothetical protein